MSLSVCVYPEHKNTLNFLLWLQKLPVELWIKIIELDLEHKLQYMFYNSIITLPKDCPYILKWKNKINDYKYGSFKIWINSDYLTIGTTLTRSICWSKNLGTPDDEVTNGYYSGNEIVFTSMDNYKYQFIKVHMNHSNNSNYIIKVKNGMLYNYGCVDFYDVCCINTFTDKISNYKNFKEVSDEKYSVDDGELWFPEELYHKYYTPIDFIRNFDYKEI